MFLNLKYFEKYYQTEFKSVGIWFFFFNFVLCFQKENKKNMENTFFFPLKNIKNTENTKFKK